MLIAIDADDQSKVCGEQVELVQLLDMQSMKEWQVNQTLIVCQSEIGRAHV